MTLRPATLEAIEDAHGFAGTYRGYLSTHLPMAVVALEAMGADDARIAAWAADYSRKLEPINQPAHELYARWVEFFAARLAQHSPGAVLREWIPRFTPAIGSAAFHCAIRTAYALEAGASAELAHALAYWVVAYQVLPAFSSPGGTKSPGEVLAAIAADASRAGRRTEGRNIAQRALSASQLPEFAGWVAAADPARVDLDSLAADVIRAYRASGDFTVLHGVTGTHAARVLSPYLAPEAPVFLWRAIVAAYVGTGAPTVRGELEGDASLDWPAIHAAAIRCDDEHDIKLAYTCWREWQRTRDDTYRRAASVRVAHAAKTGVRPRFSAVAENSGSDP